MDINLLAKFFLLFAQQAFYVPVAVIGCVWYKNKTFWHALVLLFFSMIFSTFLKMVFKVPLNPALGITGYAFPSGHFQAETIFYGWIFWSIPYKPLRVLIPMVLIGNGWAMTYFGYHDLKDEIAALFFGILILVFYKKLLHRTKNPILPGWILVGCSIPMIMFLKYTSTLPAHMWMGVYSMTGLLTGWTFWGRRTYDLSFTKKGVLTLFLFFMTYASNVFCTQPWCAEIPIFLRQAHWFVVVCLLPLSMEFFSTRTNRR